MVLEYFCPICQEEYLASDEIFITRCGHVFHQKCLHDWFVTKSTCPDCRTTCTPSQTFKVFKDYRDSELFRDMKNVLDANAAELGALQIQLNDAKTSNKNAISKKDLIIQDLESKIKTKILELEKRNSMLKIVEKKLQQLKEHDASDVVNNDYETLRNLYDDNDMYEMDRISQNFLITNDDDPLLPLYDSSDDSSVDDIRQYFSPYSDYDDDDDDDDDGEFLDDDEFLNEDSDYPNYNWNFYNF